MSNKEKVAAILQVWEEMIIPKEPPITYEGGPVIDLALMAQVAINVLTDWDKRGRS